MELEHLIESILLYKNEPVKDTELSKMLGKDIEEVRAALQNLEAHYKNRGIVIVSDGSRYALGTSPKNHEAIEAIHKGELSREIGKAGLETLAIVLYKGPVSRREIDYIRGVNSGYILRSLSVRGLIEKTDSEEGERRHSYKPTMDLLRLLGVSRKEELPEFDKTIEKIVQFTSTSESATAQNE